MKRICLLLEDYNFIVRHLDVFFSKDMQYFLYWFDYLLRFHHETTLKAKDSQYSFK